MEEAELISIVVILGLGIFSQWLAWRIQWPSIVIMSIVGLLIGPVFGFINPEMALGDLYNPLISLAVAVILYEGSSSLDIREIKGVSQSVFRIITFGALISWILGSLAAHYIAGLSLEVSFIIGGLFIVTGPTVIIPLLRQAKLKPRTAAVLKWEGIFVDPVGPLLALFAYEVIKIITNDTLDVTDLLLFFGYGIVAVIIGYLIGLLVSVLANKGLFPEFLKAPIVLAAVLICFTGSEVVMDETGMLAVTVMGLTMARMKRYVSSISNVGHFVENISVVLTSTVFILLTASLARETIADVFTLPIIGFVLVMLFIVRPLAIWVPTIGTELTKAEKTLIGWIAPRGIVALTVAGYFTNILTNDGYEHASLLMALTFALVFITVCAHGFTLTPLAKKLKLANTDPPGILIVGASRFSIALADQLKEMDMPVMITDYSKERLQPAYDEDIKVYEGEILSEHAKMEADLTPYETILAMTGDAAYNALVSQTFAPEFGFNNTYSLPSPRYVEMSSSEVPISIKAHLLFSQDAKYSDLNRKIDSEYTMKRYTVDEENTKPEDMIAEDALSLFIKKEDKSIVWITPEINRELDKGDQLVALVDNHE